MNTFPQGSLFKKCQQMKELQQDSCPQMATPAGLEKWRDRLYSEQAMVVTKTHPKRHESANTAPVV